MRPLTRNIVAVYNRATDAQRARGLRWYRDAHALACDLDPDNVSRAAGVIAALSPMTLWERNADIATGMYYHGWAQATFSANLRKARRILAGQDPLAVLGGHKVRAFYAGIIDPEGSNVVAIDRHAHDVAVGRRCTDTTRTKLTTRRTYDTFVRAYQRAAAQLGVPASHVQAVTWVVWRDEHQWSRS